MFSFGFFLQVLLAASSNNATETKTDPEHNWEIMVAGSLTGLGAGLTVFRIIFTPSNPEILDLRKKKFRNTITPPPDIRDLPSNLYSLLLRNQQFKKEK
ncbi:hypothetical protein AVEN_104364-1 [Araneus ventricosus]|uniref:Transmembrane protein 242 n=1 Tax=Araneus ventricosus TaxID=182803 RepID=A0A4Y2IYE4_ARAVE|nr:hypothetical protein AVEN_104364-1 [Araneus ventricosus]